MCPGQLAEEKFDESSDIIEEAVVFESYTASSIYAFESESGSIIVLIDLVLCTLEVWDSAEKIICFI